MKLLPTSSLKSLGVGVAIVILAAASPALPQAVQTPPPEASAAPSEVSGVTVTARPDTPDAARVKIQQFVQSHGAISRIGRIGRWRDPICPLAVGLPPAFNAFVIARVRSVATSVGAPVDKAPRCRSNVVIVFSYTPQAFLDRVAAKAPLLLGPHVASQTRKLATLSRPVQAWYATVTHGMWGDESIDGLLGPPNGASNAVSGPMGRGVVRVDDSRLTNGLSTAFGVTLIVADADKVANQEIGGVSDYMAMLALSQPQTLDGCDALPSILDLMSSACGSRPKPSALTDSDLAYLKDLYGTDTENEAGIAKSNIASRMARDGRPH
jgi:hypothetical protein